MPKVWRIDAAGVPDWKRAGADEWLVLEFDAAVLTDLCVGLCLLHERLIEELELVDRSRGNRLKVGRVPGGPEHSTIRRERELTVLLLTTPTLEMLQHFLLRTVRDRSAEVDHVDIEALDRSGAGTTVVLKFPTSRPPLSPEETSRRLGL